MWLLVMILTPSGTDVIDECIYKIFHLLIDVLELMLVLESLGKTINETGTSKSPRADRWG